MNFGCSCFWRNCWPVYGVQLVEWSRADLLFLLATVLRLEKNQGAKVYVKEEVAIKKSSTKCASDFPITRHIH